MKSSELTKLRAQVVTIQEQLQLVLEAIDRLEQDPDSKEIRQVTKTGEFSLDQELRTIPDFPQIKCVHMSISKAVIRMANPEISYYDIKPEWPTVADLLSLSKKQVKELHHVGKKRAQEIIEWMEKHHLEFNREYFLT